MNRTAAGWLCGLGIHEGQEADLDALAERRSDAAEHGQGVPLVVVVFEAGDHRVGCPNQISKLPLSQSGLRPELMDLPGDLSARPGLLQLGKPLRLKAYHALGSGFGRQAIKPLQQRYGPILLLVENQPYAVSLHCSSLANLLTHRRDPAVKALAERL